MIMTRMQVAMIARKVADAQRDGTPMPAQYAALSNADRKRVDAQAAALTAWRAS